MLAKLYFPDSSFSNEELDIIWDKYTIIYLLSLLFFRPNKDGSLHREPVMYKRAEDLELDHDTMSNNLKMLTAFLNE